MRALAVTAGLLALIPTVTAADIEPVGDLFSTLCIDAGGDGGGAPSVAKALLPGFGTGGLPIRTGNPQAQAYFDNGMQLGHAFSHKEAIEAFAKARTLDGDCAMCAWGEAWSGGPTINYTVDAKRQGELAAMADKAALLAKGGPVLEQQLTAALQKRYRNGGGAGLGDLAFAQAMDDLARAYPDNSELAVLAADAWMIPDSLRDKKDNLPRAMALIEGVLKRDPANTGAIHFYIHVTEMQGVGDKALPYAERLGGLAPAASHLVHMPSHTFYWVGQYREAARANVEAARIDMADAKRQGLDEREGAWKQYYHGHNVQFGIGGALMSNDGGDALALSDEVLATVPKMDGKSPWPQLGAATAYYAQGRFAEPGKVMALADPGAKLPYVRAMWRYARGEAAARTGDAAAVRTEAAKVKVSGGDLKPFGKFRPQGAGVVEVARLVLLGRAAMLENRPDEAARHYRKAAQIQEARFKVFVDPPIWWFPVRRSLAAALLRGGDAPGAAREAEAVLKVWPKDPMALTVLGQAARAQGKDAEAAAHFAAARKGWSGDLTKVGLGSI